MSKMYRIATLVVLFFTLISVIPVQASSQKTYAHAYWEGLAKWSPDGQQIVFSVDMVIHEFTTSLADQGDLERQVWIHDVSTGKTEYVATASEGSWCGNHLMLTIQSKEGGYYSYLADDPSIGVNGLSPSCSKDGKTLVYQKYVSDDQGYQSYQIWAGDLKTQQYRQVGIGVEPVVSPDGQRIVYVSESPNALMIMMVDGKNPVYLSMYDRNVTQPTWAPNSRTISYTGVDIHAAWVTTFDIFTGKKELLDRGAMSSWSPDGKQIVFGKYDLSIPGHWALYTMDANGTNVKRLIPVEF